MMDRGPLPFSRLGLIDDPTPRPAAWNMALDEVLLDGLGVEPWLRIYRWERPAVSIGYFEPHGPAMANWPRRDLVRRWTGGGIVAHGEDLTFSLLVPRAARLAGLPAAESYRLIHSAVARALMETGRPLATLHDTDLPSRDDSSHACFENPVRHDLMFSGQKVAGGAQRRTRRGLLHQGSIQSPAGVGGSSLDAGALSAALPRAFGQVVETRVLTLAEIETANVLASSKYGSDAWRRRR